MRSFDEIVALAAEQKGGRDALAALVALHRPKTPAEIAAIPDDRILAEMTRHVFQAGFSWKVIEAKWPGFEAAFEGFEPARCAAMSEEWFDALTKDTRIIRNGGKIRSVETNAALLVQLAAKHGSAARFFADWPDENYIGLVELVKDGTKGLGGETAMRFLRAIGKPAFITTRDVSAALVREGVLAKPPSGKRDFAAVQAAFNAWSAESGRDLTAISRILALSVG